MRMRRCSTIHRVPTTGSFGSNCKTRSMAACTVMWAWSASRSTTMPENLSGGYARMLEKSRSSVTRTRVSWLHTSTTRSSG